LLEELEIVEHYGRVNGATESMHIMLMAQCYAPEEVSAAVLITELATDLVKRGHQVTLVTGAPSYPYGRVFPGYQNRAYHVEWLDGVRVVRTWSYISPHKTFWRRALHYTTYSATAFYGGLFAGRPQVLVSFSPPLTLGISAWLLSRLWRVPWILQLEDLYPEAAIAAGVLKSRTAIAFFSAMARFLYGRASHISVIAETFRQHLLQIGVHPKRITVIPVWADPDIVRPMPKENGFREHYGLKGRFVVLYSGNIGLTSCLEDVLDVAVLLQNNPSVCFVIVGEGVRKPALEQRAQAEQLKNVLFLPFQPRERFPEMMAAADLSVVTLSPSSSRSSLPSKTFNIMASARPILAITPSNSEVAQLVQRARCGVNVPPAHSRLLAETIISLQAQPEQLTEMGNNGRTELLASFSRARCIDMYGRMLLAVLESQTR